MVQTRAQRIVRRLVAKTRSREAAARSAGVTIGSGCRILSDVATTEPWLVTIGDRVTISSNVRIVTHDGSGWLVDDERGRRFATPQCRSARTSSWEQERSLCRASASATGASWASVPS